MASFFVQLIFFTLLIIPFTSLAQSNGRVPLGTVLSTNGTGTTPWLSPSGDFAFGFRQIEGEDLFMLSIWYNNIPDQTIAWFLSSINPIQKGSSIELNAQYGLVLRDPKGELLWTAADTISKFEFGLMNDTGNFILINSDLRWAWESFAIAADTILPLQELAPGSSTNILVSRRTNSSFSKGRFGLQFGSDAVLSLSARSMTDIIDVVYYYRSKTSDVVNASNSRPRVVFDSNGFLYIRKGNNQTVDLSPHTIPSASENYFRATLNFDGVFSVYYHPRNFNGTPGWTDVWTVPENICLEVTGGMGSGACGYNNICTLVNQRPDCQCPEMYVLVDPNDKYGSCKPNFTLGCSTDENYDFVELSDTDWPLNDYEMMMPSNEADCKGYCLEDCFCAASVLRNNTCWKKKSPLSNGRVDVNIGTKAFLKYSKRSAVPPVIPDIWRPKDRGTLIAVGSVLLGSSVFINILFVLIVCFGFYLMYGKSKVRFYPSETVLESNLRCFTYKELEDATNGFECEVGRGSFGIVYRGLLSSGARENIAVKKLDRVAQDSEKEFRAEVNTIGQTHHKNLVKLLGFCDEQQHRLLVYEYMSNGTVASLLFGDSKPSWSLRTQIAIGVARAITYLHEECCTQIIHCDIKPQNILLDENYTARISDFGLAKLLVLNQSRTLTNIRGTKGYVAPEWFRNTQISAKVDVYSFGVMLLELICCRRNLADVEIGKDYTILVDWVWDCFEERILDSLVEGDIEALDDPKRLERFVMVGIWCIQEDVSLRPTMRKVSQMLEGVVEVSRPPCPVPFSYAT